MKNRISLFRKILLIIFAGILLCTCKKDTSICDCKFDSTVNAGVNVLTTSQQDEYYNIWKSILLKKNSMTDDYFNKHIKMHVISSHQWIGGVTFRMDYTLHVDWIDIKCSDAFFVKMNSSYIPYGYLNIPRDVFFDKAQIELNIANNANSEISTYHLVDALKYRNCCELQDAIKKNSGFNQAEIDYVSYYVPGVVPRENGDPYVMIKGTYNQAANQCLDGHMNLITGECKVNIGACVVY